MKKLVTVLFIACLLSACAAGQGSPIPGSLYAELRAPSLVSSVASAPKEGRAMCKSILGLVALGDCSVAAAKDAGGIQSVQHVDVDVKNYVGVYAEYTTIVRGQ